MTTVYDLVVHPGGECTFEAQCLNTNTTCDRNRCRCTQGRVFANNVCSPRCPSALLVATNGVCQIGLVMIYYLGISCIIHIWKYHFP